MAAGSVGGRSITCCVVDVVEVVVGARDPNPLRVPLQYGAANIDRQRPAIQGDVALPGSRWQRCGCQLPWSAKITWPRLAGRRGLVGFLPRRRLSVVGWHGLCFACLLLAWLGAGFLQLNL